MKALCGLLLLLAGPVWADVYPLRLADHTVQVLVERPADPGPHPLVVDLHGSGWHIDNNRANVLEWSRHDCIGMDVEFTQDVDSESVEEVKAAIEWCRRTMPVTAVGLHGFSLGARVASQTALALPDLRGLSLMSGRVKLWDGRQPVLDGIDQIACPVLIQHGQADLVVPVDNAELLAEALLKKKRPFELYLYAGVGHRLDLLDYTRPRAIRFMLRCLSIGHEQAMPRRAGI